MITHPRGHAYPIDAFLHRCTDNEVLGRSPPIGPTTNWALDPRPDRGRSAGSKWLMGPRRAALLKGLWGLGHRTVDLPQPPAPP